MQHKLGLRENAIDSLNEGLRRYSEAHQGEVRSYKFAVLHFSHFMELLLKDAVSQEHRLLLYVDPAKKNVEKSTTIGMWAALRILRNAGHALEEQLLADLNWLKPLRNQIEHFEFELDSIEVRAVLGRILRAAAQLTAALSLPAIRPDIDTAVAGVYDTLIDEYRDRLANAEADAARKAGGGHPAYCVQCGQQFTAWLSDKGLKCEFCGEIEPMRECMLCEGDFRQSECEVWNDDDPKSIDYACIFCEDRILGDRWSDG